MCDDVCFVLVSKRRCAPSQVPFSHDKLCLTGFLLVCSSSTVFTLPQGRLLSFLGFLPEGHILDVPNAALGVLYYPYILFLSHYLPSFLTRTIVSVAFASSVFLAYQLTFVIYELCVLCWSTHIVNTLLFLQFVVRPILMGTTKTAAAQQNNGVPKGKAKVY